MTDYTGENVSTTEKGSVQIYSDGDLNIVLNGDNILDEASDYGIYCEGNLTISGSGKLHIGNAATGIYAKK